MQAVDFSRPVLAAVEQFEEIPLAGLQSAVKLLEGEIREVLGRKKG
jgi:hypothetical protein